MPQLYPMNWLILYIMFLILMFIANTMNYFYLYPTPPQKNFTNNNSPKKLYWSW